MSSEAGSSGFHSCNATKSQTTGRSLKVPGLCFLISRGPVSYRDHILLWWNNHSYSPSIGFFSSCPILGLLILLQSHSRRQQDCHNFDDFFFIIIIILWWSRAISFFAYRTSIFCHCAKLGACSGLSWPPQRCYFILWTATLDPISP